MAAPFFEYAITSSWFDSDKVVAFVFYESPSTDIFFKVRLGYEFLAAKLIDYAEKYMPNDDKNQQLVFLTGQDFLMEEAKKHGYSMVYKFENREFDFAQKLNYPLPEGFHFVNPKDCDPVKLSRRRIQLKSMM